MTETEQEVGLGRFSCDAGEKRRKPVEARKGYSSILDQQGWMWGTHNLGVVQAVCLGSFLFKSTLTADRCVRKNTNSASESKEKRTIDQQPLLMTR